MEENLEKHRLDSGRSAARDLKRDKKDKKHKKHKKEKKHKKSKKVKRSRRDDLSDSSDSSSDDEWVEKPARQESGNPKRDDWMLMSSFGASFKTKDELQPRRNPKEDACKRAMDQPGQTSRELNPYWKNGGTGLPPEDPKKFHRPGKHSDEEETSQSSASSFSTKRQGWKKSSTAVSSSTSPEPAASEDTRPRVTASHQTGLLESDKVWTDQELNALGAKIVKAEIMGNEDLANSLKKTLAEARQQMERQKVEGAASKQKEAILLTYTDSRGVSRPLAAPSGSSKGSSSEGRGRKREKVDTHELGKRVRYFADDDKRSLSKMFEKEKLNTAEDENLVFSTLAGARAERNNDEYDIDDMFVSRAHKGDERSTEERDRARAVTQHQQREKALSSCTYCIDSEVMQKHLIIALAEKSYLCLPQHESLTTGHCLIVPRSHVTCATQLDEDVWEEMQLFRKALTRMFEADDEDPVFFETAMNLRYFPHMVIECVPLDRNAGDTAPIYFKKALLECESEWSMNKKVIDLRGKDVRRGVPRGLPYFFVDFGLDSGFAHVIEDEKQFPRNFAQEILGGIMDLEPRLWRRPRKESFEEQRKKVLDFMAKWKPFDFTSSSK